MRILDRLERRFGRFAVPNLTQGILLCQVVVFAVASSRPEVLDNAALIPDLVLNGELYRLVTFFLVPPGDSLILNFFAWYMFYLMGTALEQAWGTFRYNAFLLVGYVASVAAAFAVLDQPASNAFLGASIFLAFALVFPEFVINVFFFIPVKVKWLALIQWLGYLLLLAEGNWQVRMLIVAALLNVLLFCRREIREVVRGTRRVVIGPIKPLAREERRPFHTCVVCGRNDVTNPELDFRYCSQCEGTYGYCPEHIRAHEHIKRGGTAAVESGKRKAESGTGP